MANEDDIKRYTAEEIRAIRKRGEEQTDWAKVDAMTEADLEAAIASDSDEADVEWERDKAKLVMPEPKEPVNLRVDEDAPHPFKPLTAKEIAEIPDEAIDYSDIPDLDEEFWENSRLVMPDAKERTSKKNHR